MCESWPHSTATSNLFQVPYFVIKLVIDDITDTNPSVLHLLFKPYYTYTTSEFTQTEQTVVRYWKYWDQNRSNHTSFSWLAYLALCVKPDYRRLVRRLLNMFVRQKYARNKAGVEVSHVFSRYFIEQISCVSHFFTVEAVTLQNKKDFLERKWMKSLWTAARENSTNCEICIGNSCVRTFFLWNSHETCSRVFCESSVAGLTVLDRKCKLWTTCRQSIQFFRLSIWIYR